MPSANFKSYLSLHFIVFIWGFTGVLGDLISIREDSLVWYRMLLAAIFIRLWLLATKTPLKVPRREFKNLIVTGMLIGVHWVLFFTAINVSNVSITLAMFSLGAFFAAVLEPLFYGRKMLWYEIFFGLVIMGALVIIMQVEFRYLWGMILALLAVLVGVLFTLINGKLTQKYDARVITYYEFLAGFALVSVIVAARGKFNAAFFDISPRDWGLLLLLSSVCTAWAFTASVSVMRKLSPYTVMLTTNLEPVYGIVLAWLLLGEDEQMSPGFYIGAALIVIVVALNGIIKARTSQKG